MSDQAAILLGRIYERLEDIMDREVWLHTDSKHDYEDWKDRLDKVPADYHGQLRFLKGDIEEMHALIAEVVEREI